MELRKFGIGINIGTLVIIHKGCDKLRIVITLYRHSVIKTVNKPCVFGQIRRRSINLH